MDILLKGGTIIDPDRNMEETGDVLVRDGKILKTGGDLSAQTSGQTKVLDVQKLYVVPGLIDIHVHFRDPGFPAKETIETGAAAAAAGGFTTVVCMPNTQPVIDNMETINYINGKAAKAPCNVLMMGSVTLGEDGKECSPYREMLEGGIVGITDDGKPVMDSGVLYEAMMQAKELKLPVSSHCEDMGLCYDRTITTGKTAEKLGVHGVPPLAEEIIIQRDIMVAEATGAHLHIQHISSAKGVELVRQAKARGVRVTAEAAPHHFTLSEESVLIHGTHAKMSPPLRTPEDVKAVIQGLVDGTIDAIADDHAPHTPEEKSRSMLEAPNGIIGIETTLGVSLHSLVHAGHLSFRELIEKLTINPARLLNIPRGTLRDNACADITVIDPQKEWVVDSSKFRSKARNTPYEGMKLKGKAVITICRGEIVHNEHGEAHV
ncbi:MAG: dihydroorotase [Dethiosulfovibrio peptidovorans]|nr:MAG: dihydroorotase [Dethiosulfovibrio peptidovorans]